MSSSYVYAQQQQTQQQRAQYDTQARIDAQNAPTYTPALADGTSAEYVDFMGAVKRYDYTSGPQARQRQTYTGTRGFRPYFDAVGPDNQVVEGITDQTPQQSGEQFMQAVDAPFRAFNTVVAGTTMALNNPSYVTRFDADPTDGVTLGDIWNYYGQVWDAEITPGQAIGIAWADRIKFLNGIVGLDMQKKLDAYIEADNAARLADPTNERQLRSWLMGLHSDFDPFDENDKDSAFNQGLGRWITGASDATIAIAVGIDVLVAKGLMGGYRKATQQVLATGGARGSINPGEFKARVISHNAGVEVTAEGQLIDEIYRMTPEEAAHHPIVLDSDNPALVASIVGTQFDSKEQAADAFLAMLGDYGSAARLKAERLDLYDNLLGAKEELDALRWNIRNGADRNLDDYTDLGDNYAAIFGTDVSQNLDHYDQLADIAEGAVKSLKDDVAKADTVSAFTTGRFGTEVSLTPVIGRATRGGRGRTFRYDKRAGVYSKRSARGMQAKAQRRMERFTGSAYEHTVIKLPGMNRGIRFVNIRSGLDYLGKHRQTGVLNFQDNVEFMREFRAALETAPFLRRAAKQTGEGRLITRRLPNGDTVSETVEEFRTRLLSEAQDVALSTPAAKAAFAERFEMEMVEAMGAALGESPAAMQEIAKKYVARRSFIRGHLANHKWVVDNGEVVVLDEMTLATQRNGYTLMDFKWLQDSIKIERSGWGARKGRGAAEKLLTVIDYVWRPLVLLRLGYTQRNIAEGYLRTLAAFGEVPTTGHVGTSSKNFFLNAGDRIAGGTNRFRNMIVKRQGLRKIRRNMSKMRQQQDRDLADLKLNREERRALAKQMARRRKAARRAAEQEFLRRSRTNMQVMESPVWTQISEDLTEAQVRMLDTADTLIYDPNATSSITARGLLEPDPATGVGVADAEALTRSMMGPEAVEIGGMADELSPRDFMTPSMLRNYDEFVAAYWDENAGAWVDDAAAFEHQDMLQAAYVRRLRQLAKSDYRIGRIDRDGRFKVIRSSTFDDVTFDEFNSGAIVAVPKSVNPRYAKADVYGGVLDIRTNVQAETMNVARDVATARSAMDRFLEIQQRGREPGQARVYSPEEVEELSTELTSALTRLLGPDAPVAQNDIVAFLNALESNPQAARAVAVSKWIRDNADRLPDDFMEWATKNKLILTSAELKKLVRRQSRISRDIEDASNIRNDLEAMLRDQSRYGNTGFPEHSGAVIYNDVATDVLVDGNTMQLLNGPGIYSATGDGGVTSDYHMAHIMKAIGQAGSPSSAPYEPVVYMLPDPAGYAWMDVDAPVISATGELNPQVEDLIQVLDDPKFSLGTSGETIGSRIRTSLESTLPGNERVADVWRRVRTLAYSVVDDLGAPGVGPTYDIIDAMRRAGYDGIITNTYASGPTHVWWTKDLPLTRLDEISDVGLEYVSTVTRVNRLASQLDQAVAGREVMEKLPYDARSMSITNPKPGEGFGAVNARIERLLAQYARERGYGKVLVDDPATTEGFRALFVPDMVGTNEGFLDNLIPGQVAEAGRGNPSVIDISTGSASRQILEEYDPALAKRAFRGTLSRNDKAKLAMFMERGSFTHILLPTSRGKQPVLLSASELIGQDGAGLAYVRLGLKDEVDDRMAAILAKSPEYADDMAKMRELDRIGANLNKSVGQRRATLKELGDSLDRLRPKARRKVVTGGVESEKRVEIVGRQGQARLETGEVFDPNEALSGQYQSLASSGSFHDLMIVGYMQNRYAQYERSFNFVKYTPGDDRYWLAMTGLVNDNIRQDPIMRRIIQQPRVALDDPDAIAAQNEALIRELVQDDAFLQGVRTGIYDTANLETTIAELREKVYQWLPDDELMAAAGRGPLQPDQLQAKLAWRDDLVTIEEKELAEIGNLYRRFLNRAMSGLGTIPEDNLIRHPFYRKRWKELMQQQVDEYEMNGVTSFTPAQVDAMRRSAHAGALRATRETTYTISRLSTPAAALGLLIPFFPAWENALRFWSREFTQRPENLMRYVQIYNAPNSMGMVVDGEGNPLEAKRGIFGLPEALFAPGEAYLQFSLPQGVADNISKIPGLDLGTKGQIRISKGSLNVALQGDYPWLTNFGPIVSVPVSWIAAQKPDYADAIINFEAGGLPIGDAITKTVVPFARPTAEKQIWAAALDQFTPTTARRALTAILGWSDAEFVGTVEEIRRDMTIDWERGGRQGNPPTPEEATARARELFALRAVGSFTLPFAASYQSKYQPYVEEWRRISDKHMQIQDSAARFNAPLPDEKPIGYQAALREFLDLHGQAFFYLTQSASGRAGVGASVGEYKILEQNPTLASDLATSGEIDHVAMITSPYAGEFSQPVYAYQMNRAFENSTTLMRGGDPEDVIKKGQVARGWILYRDGMNGLEAMLEERGLTSFEQTGAEDLKDLKVLLEADIAKANPEWERQRDLFDRGEWKTVVKNIDLILGNKKFMDAHGDEPLWVDVAEWRDKRREIGQILIEQKRELGDDASLNINSSTNAPIKMMWDEWVLQKKRENLAFADFYNRFLDYDTLLPGDPEDRIVLQSEYLQQPEMAMGGAP
jgi:hypothetical protein